MHLLINEILRIIDEIKCLHSFFFFVYLQLKKNFHCSETYFSYFHWSGLLSDYFLLIFRTINIRYSHHQFLFTTELYKMTKSI